MGFHKNMRRVLRTNWAVKAYMPSCAKEKRVIWDFKGEEGNSHGDQKAYNINKCVLGLADIMNSDLKALWSLPTASPHSL